MANDGAEALHTFLQGEPTLVVRSDEDYGRIFEFTFTPCCIPLSALYWFNAVSRGVFLRIIFAPSGRLPNPMEALSILNTLNYDLPVGTFTANLETGEIRFKNAVFIGDQDLDEQILGNLTASAFETVRVCHSAIVRALTGQNHSH